MTQRSFLILHGLENHRPPQHWEFLLAAYLVQRGHDVHYPALPDPDAPRYAVWEAVLHRLLDEMVGDERVVICHSLSCLLWFGAASGILPDQRPDRLLLVAAPASQLVPESGAGFRLRRFEPDAVRVSVTTPPVIVCSDNDPFNFDAAGMYADPIGVPPVMVHGAGHFTPDSGYGVWQALQAWCEDPSASLG